MPAEPKTAKSDQPALGAMLDRAKNGNIAFRDRGKFNNRIRFVGKITAEEPISIKIPNEPALPRFGGVPYLTATGLRGRLRNNAATIVFNAMRELGIPISLKSYYAATIGGIKDGKEAEENAAAKAFDYTRDQMVSGILRTVSPITGIFGLADPFTQGSLFVGHGLMDKDGQGELIETIRKASISKRDEEWGTSPEMMVRTVRRDSVTYRKDGFSFLDESQQKEWQNRRLKAVENSKDKKDAKAVAKEAGKDATTEQKNAANASLKIVNADNPNIKYEAIPPGTVFTHRMRLEHVSLEEIGLFLEAMALFAENPRIGGQVARGCGLVSMRYDIELAVGTGFDFEWKKIDELTISEDGISRPTSEFLLSAIAANKTALRTSPEAGGYMLQDLPQDVFEILSAEHKLANGEKPGKKKGKTKGNDGDDDSEIEATI